MSEGSRPLAARAVEVGAGTPWLITGKGALSYGELEERSARLNGLLRECGLVDGDRVILASRNDLDMGWIALGLLRAGFTAVLLDPDFTPSEAAFATGLSRVAAVIADRELLDAWGLHDAAPRVLPLDPSGPRKANLVTRLLGKKREPEAGPADGLHARLAAAKALPASAAPAAESTAYIIFTSGTTGRPRGVEMSHRGLLAHLGTLERQMGYDPKTRILNVLPLSHVDGLVQGVFVSYYVGGSCHRPCAFNAQNLGLLLDSVYSQRITHMVSVPTMLALTARLSSGLEDSFRTDDFRFIISAAGPLDAELWASFEERFGTRVVNLYGLTETVTGGLFAGPDDASHRHGTVGKPVDCEARIVDDAANDVAPGQEGELWLRGDNLMSGYFDDPEATAAAMPGGWLRTGDLATCDAEGLYRIVGRKKDIIVCGGMNIAPQEVAEVLKGHPGVLDAAVLGLPDAQWGEIPVAVLVARGVPPSHTELASHCRATLAAYKLPREILFVDELPRGRSGKVVARELAARVAELRSARVEVRGTGDVLQRVCALAAERFHVSASQLDATSSPANTAGWDSMAHMALVSALEDAFGVELTTRQIMSIESLARAAEVVEELQRAR